MNEQQWLTSVDPQVMLEWARNPSVDLRNRSAQRQAYKTLSDRKLRLFVEACRALFSSREGVVANWLDLDKEPGQLLSCLETWSGSRGGVNYRKKYLPMAERADILRDIADNPFRPVAFSMYRGTVWHAADDLRQTIFSLAHAAYDHRQDDGTLDPCRLSILADALVEAGCPEEMESEWIRPEGCGVPVQDLQCAACDVKLYGQRIEDVCPYCSVTGRVPHPLIAHLRSPGPHVRGCHVVDLLTGRS